MNTIAATDPLLVKSYGGAEAYRQLIDEDAFVHNYARIEAAKLIACTSFTAGAVIVLGTNETNSVAENGARWGAYFVLGASATAGAIYALNEWSRNFDKTEEPEARQQG